MARMDVIETSRESDCVECGETIKPGTKKLLFDGYRRYKTAHLDCVGVEVKQ